MKIPVGIILESSEIVKEKYLLTPVDMGHYLKLPAGVGLFEKYGDNEITVADKLKQVFIQIMNVVNKTGDRKILEKATQNLPKIKTKIFTKNLELEEREVIFINVTQSSDLMPPDGDLLKKLVSSYPFFYMKSKQKAKLSRIIEMVQNGESFIILNDLYNPIENRIVIEYGEKLNNDFLKRNGTEIMALLKERKKENFIDKLSTGEDIAKNNICNYYGIPLKKSGEILKEDFFNSAQFREILSADPEIFYLNEKQPTGIALIDINNNSSLAIKRFLKTSFHQFKCESKSIDQLSNIIKEYNPKIIILSLDEPVEISKLLNIRNSVPKDYEFILLLSGKSSEIEHQLRSSGYTFIFEKSELFKNYNQFGEVLNNVISMLD